MFRIDVSVANIKKLQFNIRNYLQQGIIDDVGTVNNLYNSNKNLCLQIYFDKDVSNVISGLPYMAHIRSNANFVGPYRVRSFL